MQRDGSAGRSWDAFIAGEVSGDQEGCIALDAEIRDNNAHGVRRASTAYTLIILSYHARDHAAADLDARNADEREVYTDDSGVG